MGVAAGVASCSGATKLEVAYVWRVWALLSSGGGKCRSGIDLFFGVGSFGKLRLGTSS